MPEKTTKKRRSYVSVLFFLLLLLTLVSFCFLGTTFARYTSGGFGTGTVSVAKWEITADNAEKSGDTTATFAKLSPSDEAYDADSQTTRSNTSDLVLIATIENKSEVDALVTLSEAEGGPEITLSDSSDYSLPTEEDDTSITSSDDSTGIEVSAVQGLFSVTFYYSVTKLSDLTDVNSATEYTDAGIKLDATTTENGNSKVYIYATVTWTTADSDGNGDELDTWVGENVESVSFTIDYTAVQDSTLPVTQTDSNP